MADEEKERKEKKVAAQKEKEVGNAAYKKKDFETAIQHYTKYMELNDEDISYLTSRAVVYLEMGQARVRLATDTLPKTPHSAGALCTGFQSDECIKDCDMAVERAKELRADFKMISRH